jgi:hypothetical protein
MPKVGFGGMREGAKVTAEIAISGQTVIAKISGEYVELQSGTGPILASISGGTVIAKISGETIELQSGTGPILASISGETIITAPWIATDVKTGPVRTVAGASGGVVLHSGAVKSLKVKAVPDNSGDIYIGGSTNRPYSGFGFCLAPGEAEMMDVGDFHWVYLFAVASGDRVCFDGIND